MNCVVALMALAPQTRMRTTVKQGDWGSEDLAVPYMVDLGRLPAPQGPQL